MSHYFFYDFRDSGMDFFHSLEYVHGKAPYEKYGTLYPPLANLFFLLMYYLVAPSQFTNWPSDFYEGLSLRCTYWDLRTFQGPMFAFIIVLVITAWMFASLVNCVFKKIPYRQANTVAFCMLLSPAMLYAFDRGNILYFVVPLCLFFVCYRNSESWIMRELSLVALAIAAGLKLYPAFFGVLLIRDKKYAQSIRAVVYGILSVVLPILVFEEGLSGIPQWLSVVFRYVSSDETPYVGTGFTSILHRIALYADLYLGWEISTDWFAHAAKIVSILLLVVALFFKKDWQSALAATFAIIMFGSNGQYIYAFVIVPAILFMLEEEKFSKNNIIPYVLMMLLCINLPLFYTNNAHYPNVAIKQLISLLIVTWCFVAGAVTILKLIDNKFFRRKSNGDLEERG